MFKNYLKVTIRNTLKNKLYSFISIVGFAIGIACCFLMLLWIDYEYSYDQFNMNIDNLFRVVSRTKKGDDFIESCGTPAPLGNFLKKEFPEVIDATRLMLIDGPELLEFNNQFIQDMNIFLVDPSFIQMFSFPIIKGESFNAFSDINSVIISQKMAKKYFYNDDPIGKKIKIFGKECKITGVVFVPQTSHIQFDCLAPFAFYEKSYQLSLSWASPGGTTYLQLKKKSDSKTLNKKILHRIGLPSTRLRNTFSLQPIGKIHLNSNLKYHMSVKNEFIYIYFLYILAFLMLFSACLNFINLSTAQFSKRYKEIRIRKISGANYFDHFSQFFGETFFFTIIAFILAFFLLLYLLPTFNSLIGIKLNIHSTGFFRITLIFTALIAMTSILSGTIPSFNFSGFSILFSKSLNSKKKNSGTIRRVLILCQLILSIMLIIAVLIVQAQLKFIKNKNLGFNKNSLIIISGFTFSEYDYEIYKRKMLNFSNILDVTRGFLPIFYNGSTVNVKCENQKSDSKTIMQYYPVDFDFFKTLQIKIKEGRTFLKYIPSDKKDAYIVNETAVKTMSIKDPIGKKIKIEGKEGKIIGVVNDFHHSSLRNPILPVLFKIGTTYNLILRIKNEKYSLKNTIAFLKALWRNESSFKYHILNDLVSYNYSAEKRIITIFTYFAALALLINSLGLLGLAAFTADQRTKEIGIRKAMGSNLSKLFFVLTKEYLVLVLLANFIAWPLAYDIMKLWIEEFTYHTKIDLWLFFTAGLISFTITILTVSFHTIKSALKNPVNSLRHE